MPLSYGSNSLIPEILQADKEEIQPNKVKVKVVSQEESVEVRQSKWLRGDKCPTGVR